MQELADEARELADEAQELVDEAEELIDEAREMADEDDDGSGDDDDGSGPGTRQFDWHGPNGARLHLDVSDLDQLRERLDVIRGHFDRFRARSSALLDIVRDHRPRG